MELHSYAKHRTAKKWSIEQKRRLVEARISCDPIFQSKPTTSILPWKSVIFQAKLDDFNIVFVRKQWANMVTKYMQHKQARLGNRPTHDIDAETIKKITQEWEFFEPIHRYMTRKTANLHSYALTSHRKVSVSGETGTFKQNSASSNERLNACSSDTNDAALVPNTDHDFYSKRAEQQQLYFADVEEDTLESIKTEPVVANETVTNWFTNADAEEDTLESIKTEPENNETVTNWFTNGADLENAQCSTDVVEHSDVVMEQQIREKSNSNNINTTTTTANAKVQEMASNHSQQGRKTHPKLLTEREKYYRHKRRYHHRMERRFDAVLNVMGQLAKTVCPDLDISPLLKTGGELVCNMLESSSSSSSSSENENDH